MSNVSVVEHAIVVSEPSWKDIQELQRTLTKHDTMVGIVFVKLLANNFMDFTKIRHNRISVWLDQGDEMCHEIIKATNKAVQTNLDAKSMYDEFRPRGIPEDRLPRPEFYITRKDVSDVLGRGMTNPEMLIVDLGVK